MVANKQLSKILYSSTTTLSVWAILSRIAYAEEENSTSSIPNEISSGTTAGTAIHTSDPVTTTTQVTHVATQTTPPEQIFGLVDTETAIYILFGITVVSLILAILGLISRASTDKVDKLQKDLSRAHEQIKKLHEQNTKNKNNLETLRDYVNKHNSLLTKSITQSTKKSVIEEKIIPSNVETTETTNLKELYLPLIQDYNNFTYQPFTSSFNERNAKLAFTKKYTIKRFWCENSEDRLDNPALLPIFKDTDIKTNDVYWAVHLKNEQYAVIPKLGIAYEYQLHVPSDMKNTFISNYTKGVFKKIIIKKPAIFDYTNGIWTLKERGEIELSN